MKKQVLLLSLGLMLLVGCGKEEGKKKESSSTLPVQILAVNDFHGSLDTTGTLHQQNGTEIENAGTAAKLATVLNQCERAFQKEENAKATQTIRVESGDLVGASPATSGLLQDEPTIKAFNAMDFKVGTLGNHEFDEGLAEFNRVLQAQPWQKENKMTKNAVAHYPQEKSKLTLITSNIVTKSGKTPYQFKPYTTITVKKGVKVGFIGVTTGKIKELVLKNNMSGYKVLDPATQIVKYSKVLQKQGVNAICVLAHTGALESENGEASETEQILNKVKQLDKNTSVDAVIAGHDHGIQNKKYKDILITEAENQGKAVTNITANIDLKTKDFVATPKAKTVAVTEKTKENKKVKAIVLQAQKAVDPIVNKVIGTTKNKKMISEKMNSDGTSPIANLVTKAQYTEAKKEYPQLEAVITNTGGIRDDLVVNDKGEITWGAANAVQPFGNVVQVVKIKGKAIKQAVDLSLKQKEASLQYYNISYTPQNGKAVDIKIANAPLKDNKEYIIAMNDFLCGGGDHYQMLASGHILGGVGCDTDIFVNYIKTHSPV